ncbi:MAG: hypothetical protein KAJ21_04225 [Thermoplasmatales archaeon]|nr:hypothetical protein [Thermoplasmatales archaeon]
MDEKGKIKMLVMIGAIFWIIGLLMILYAIAIEVFQIGDIGQSADNISSKLMMTLKLGGIGFTLSGIFLSLVAIVKALTLMPVNLGKLLKK